MSFAQPVWLYLIPILLLIFGGMLAYGMRKRSALLSRFAAERLLDQLTEEASHTRTLIKSICILIAAAAVGFALARPQLGVEWSERKSRGLDIVFIIDSSKSMLATDLRPTRLDRAKLAVVDLVERLESDRIGLVAFAGQAFLQTPPTLDYSAFRESLDSLNPGIMTSGGSDLGYALEESAKAFPSENNVKVAVLLTDGEDLGGNAITAANDALEQGIQVFAIGIGTPEGEYLRIKNEQGDDEFVRDSSGQPVLSKLDESNLQEIARITGGSYSRLSGDSLDQLYNSVIATLPREERESELQEIRIERFQWAISTAIGLLFLDVLIRRRRQTRVTAGIVLFTALAISPNQARAYTENLAPSSQVLYNEAYQAISEGDYAKATELYEASIAASQDIRLQSDALYNLGHSNHQLALETYQGGDPEGALEQIKKAESLFKSAQEMNPSIDGIEQDLEQIGEVREAIEQLLDQEQEEQDQENEDSEDSEQSEEQDEQSEQDENSEGESSEENSESQDQEGDSEQQDQESGEPGEQSEDESESSQSEQGEQDENSEEESQSADEESQEESEENEPQPEAGEESSDEEGEEEQSDTPQPGEEEAGQDGEGNPMDGQVIEGMSAEDAAALLDSLRNKETLLPFIDQNRSGRQRDVRDW